jgi:C4-dicarboxylate-specific signal transduction histidine kinase
MDHSVCPQYHHGKANDGTHATDRTLSSIGKMAAGIAYEINNPLGVIQCSDLVKDAVKDHVLLCIEDNGPGIQNHVISQIFDQFYTTKEVGKGVGKVFSWQQIKGPGSWMKSVISVRLSRPNF